MTLGGNRTVASLALGLLLLYFAAPNHLPGQSGHDHDGQAHPATDPHGHDVGDEHSDPDHPGHACECPETPVTRIGGGPELGLPQDLGLAAPLAAQTLRACMAATDDVRSACPLVDQQRPPPRPATILFSIRRL